MSIPNSYSEFLKNAKRKDLIEEINRNLTLLQINEQLISSLKFEQVLANVLQQAKILSGAENASIFLINKEKQYLEFTATTDEDQADTLKDIHIPIGKGIAGFVAQEGKMLNLSNVQEDNRFFKDVDNSTGETTSSYLCVPLIVQSEVIGTAQLLNKLNGDVFNSDDERMINNFASLAALAIETALLHKLALQKQAMEQEVKFASEIQSRLLAKEDPILPFTSITGYNQAARVVGGDYYNYFEHQLPNGEKVWDIIIADVSGKGIPASLIVSNLHAALQLLLPLYDDLSKFAFHLNNFLLRNLITGCFITFFVARYNAENGELQYVNCGHNPPYLFPFSDKNKTTITLESSGPFLGLGKDIHYKSYSTKLYPKDLLVLFSDGVSEAQNKTEELFSEERLQREIIKSYNTFSQDKNKESNKENNQQIVSSSQVSLTKKIKNHLINEIKNFRDNATVNDDTTFIIISRE